MTRRCRNSLSRLRERAGVRADLGARTLTPTLSLEGRGRKKP